MIDSLQVPDGALVDEFAGLIRGRRTINLFEPEPVPQELLLEAIEVARWAPNHRLTEPWRFYLPGPVTTAAIIDCWAAFEAAGKGEAAAVVRRKRLEMIPGHFIVTSARHADELIELENYAASCCAVQNLMLYLWARGVGVKWTTGDITRLPAFIELLGIDSDAERIVGYFWYGKPRIIAPQQRRPVEAIISRRS